MNLKVETIKLIETFLFMQTIIVLRAVDWLHGQLD